MKYKIVLTKHADTVIRVMYGGCDIDEQLKKINQ